MTTALTHPTRSDAMSDAEDARNRELNEAIRACGKSASGHVPYRHSETKELRCMNCPARFLTLLYPERMPVPVYSDEDFT